MTFKIATYERVKERKLKKRKTKRNKMVASCGMLIKTPEGGLGRHEKARYLSIAQFAFKKQLFAFLSSLFLYTFVLTTA